MAFCVVCATDSSNDTMSFFATGPKRLIMFHTRPSLVYAGFAAITACFAADNVDSASSSLTSNSFNVGVSFVAK